MQVIHADPRPRFYSLGTSRRKRHRTRPKQLLDIRRRLRAHLQSVDDADPPYRDDGLISLLRATDLLTQVWSPDEVQKQLRPLIIERTRRVSLGLEAKLQSDAQALILIVGLM